MEINSQKLCVLGTRVINQFFKYSEFSNTKSISHTSLHTLAMQFHLSCEQCRTKVLASTENADLTNIMHKNCSLFLLIISVLTVQFVNADTANPTFSIGNRNIAIEAPPGFHEVTQLSDYDRKLMESFTPDSQSLLGAFYTEADIGRVLKNEDPYLETYILVKVLKSREQSSMSKKEFNKFKLFAKNNFGKITDIVAKNISSIFESASKDITELSGLIQEIKANQIVQLGVFNETDNSLSSAMFTRYNYTNDISDGSYVAAITSTFLLVQDKMLSIDMYQLFEQPKDLVELRSTTSSWMEGFE